jgi:multidrug efflux system membrane fusion protein
MTLSRVSRIPMRLTNLARPAGLGTLAMLLLSGACAKAPPARTKSAVPVVVTRARLADIPYTIDANGVVVPLQSASVGSQVEGIVQKVSFREGQDVTRGQVLFQIDPRPYQAAYRQAAANLARDKANAENARLEADRYVTLAQKDYVTKEQADQLRATAAASAATVAADEALLANAKFNLDNATIRAPISGRTGALLVREGNLVHASGATPLVVINQVSPILVRFAIPATQLPLLQRYGSNGGLEVTSTPNSGADQTTDTASATIGLNMGGGDPSASSPNSTPGAHSGGGNAPASSQLVAISEAQHGALSFIDNAVDTTTGTVLLKASFPNANKRLWAGEFVSTQLKLFVEQNALVVPSSAVVTGQQGAYVYVISDTLTAQQRPVKVERTAGNLSIIASGLRAGEQVVTDGQSRLTPNSKVTITTPQGTAGGGGRRGGGAGGRGRGGRGTAGVAGGTGGGAASGAPAAGAPAGGAATSAPVGAAPAGGAGDAPATGRGRGGRGGRGTGGAGRGGQAAGNSPPASAPQQ